LSQDDAGGHGGQGTYDPHMHLPYDPTTDRRQQKPRPDGELGPIIDSFKRSADADDVVPNGLLTFEFEGRNSMISDLSSLNSFNGDEASLNLDNLPDSIKRQFK
jgi:hypothetical protein